MNNIPIVVASDLGSVIGTVTISDEMKLLIEDNVVANHVSLRPNFTIDERGVTIHSFSLQVIQSSD